MSNYAFVLNINRQPLNPIHPAAARKLLGQSKAAIFRKFPFTIILKEESTESMQPLEIKIDPGSKCTGLAILCESKLIWAAELTHRGATIQAALMSRRQLRRGRRNRKTRYRPARFLNRTRRQGWLAPSLQHRVDTTLTWIEKLMRVAPVQAIAQELVRLDAACVGEVSNLEILTNRPLLIKCQGHGTRQACRTDKFGFPNRYVPRFKFINGFQTGDIVKAIVIKGKKIGIYIGRVAVRSSGNFNISTNTGLIQGISHKYCRVVHAKDGYNYSF